MEMAHARRRSPSWSPDGTKVVFGNDRDDNPAVYVMNADGTNPTNPTNSGPANPVAAVAAGAVVLGGATWYGRRRRNDQSLRPSLMAGRNGS